MLGALKNRGPALQIKQIVESCKTTIETHEEDFWCSHVPPGNFPINLAGQAGGTSPRAFWVFPPSLNSVTLDLPGPYPLLKPNPRQNKAPKFTKDKGAPRQLPGWYEYYASVVEGAPAFLAAGFFPAAFFSALAARPFARPAPL